MQRIFLLIFLSCTGIYYAAASSINPIVGDLSYLEKFGHFPVSAENDQVRIATHLAFIEENLRAKDVSYLSKKMQKKRLKMLDLLREYIQQAKFPNNYDYAERKPCFIDRDGNICAVGYLVAQSAGLNVAQAINAKHQYDYIYDMKMPELDNWIAKSGLTKEECAMIQPNYSSPYVDPQFAKNSAIYSGASLAFTVLNYKPAKRGAMTIASTTAGVTFGILSINYGAREIENQSGNMMVSYPKNIPYAYFNIVSGSASIVMSTYKLVEAYTNKKETKDKTVFFAPAPILTDRGAAPGFGFNYTF